MKSTWLAGRALRESTGQNSGSNSSFAARTHIPWSFLRRSPSLPQPPSSAPPLILPSQHHPPRPKSLKVLSNGGDPKSHRWSHRLPRPTPSRQDNARRPRLLGNTLLPPRLSYAKHAAVHDHFWRMYASCRSGDGSSLAVLQKVPCRVVASLVFHTRLTVGFR